MANAFKGEFPIEGTPYVLRYTYNSLCEIESRAGVNFLVVMNRMNPQPSLSDVRLLLWGGLLHNQPDLTIEQAGDIIEDLGYAKVLGEVMSGIRLGMKSSTNSSGEVKAVANTG